ncbi:MAG: hypothetical protein HYS13_20760 [Planctomycetia bacterium]|nr:hypothetical protein [Planctomycetia bacterium]
MTKVWRAATLLVFCALGATLAVYVVRGPRPAAATTSTTAVTAAGGGDQNAAVADPSQGHAAATRAVDDDTPPWPDDRDVKPGASPANDSVETSSTRPDPVENRTAASGASGSDAAASDPVEQKGPILRWPLERIEPISPPYRARQAPPEQDAESESGAPAMAAPAQGAPRPAVDSSAAAVAAAHEAPAVGGTAPALARNAPAPAAANQAAALPTMQVRTSDTGGGLLEVVYAREQDIREVLAMLSAQGKMKYMPTKSVSGTISLQLENVTVEKVIETILRSQGLVSRQIGDFVYVGTPKDFTDQDLLHDRIGTRIFRPNYVRAADLEKMLKPLLTEVGKISISEPSKIGIPSDDKEAGGDMLAASEALVVQDYESVLAQVEQIVHEMDRRPMQVQIEAMILSVQLNDEQKCGIDFQLLRDQGTIRLGIGSPESALGGVSFADGGLKFAFLDSNFSAFVSALETVGDTDVIATPRLMTLNKQRAEILIGAQLGYINTTVTETTATQSVNFLEVGTQLRLRPFISADGLIRMEVHPELSTGRVRVEGGFTLPDKEVTKVTTNIMVRDGCTVVIGGLMREDLVTTGRQVAFVGDLPVVGRLFRHQDEKIERREIVILVTPRIVYEPDTCVEGEQAACEFHRRHSVRADHFSPLGKRYLARKYFRTAQEAWAVGDRDGALLNLDMAIHIDPTNRAAIDLRSDVLGGVPDGEHALPPSGPPPGPPLGAPAAHEALDGLSVAPWLIEELYGNSRGAMPPAAPIDHPLDPGRPGESKPIVRPGSMP